MKTIKFSLLGLLFLFISILLLKYAVISFNYITTDFTTASTKDIYNFGLTFAIQAVILSGLSFTCIATFIACMQLTIKYYNISAKIRRDNALLKHLEEEKYNDLVDKLRSTNDTVLKHEYIQEYLNKNPNKLIGITPDNSIGVNNTGKLIKPNTTLDFDLLGNSYMKDNIEFERIDRNIHKD